MTPETGNYSTNGADTVDQNLPYWMSGLNGEYFTGTSMSTVTISCNNTNKERVWNCLRPPCWWLEKLENRDISLYFWGTIWPSPRDLMLMAKRSECHADFRNVLHIAPRSISTCLTWQFLWNMHRSSPITILTHIGALCQHQLC